MSTSRIRSYRPEHHGTLKDAMVELVDAAGGLRRAADLTRLNKTRLGEICSPHREDVHAPLDVVQALEMATGCRAVTHHLAARHGVLLVDMGMTETMVVLNDRRGGVLRSNADAVKAAAEAISSQMDAAADGVIDADEASALLPAVEGALQHMARLRHLLLVMTNEGDDGLEEDVSD